LFLSIYFCTGRDSFFLIWVAIEVNLLCFVPLIVLKSKYSIEAALKYFLIQSFRSFFFLCFSIGCVFQVYLSNRIILIAIIVKLGVAPFHQWVPSTVEGISWERVFILLTAQKVIPLSVHRYIDADNNLIGGFIFCSALVGGLGGVRQTRLRKILAYSSISHISWLLRGVLLRNYIWVRYFILYSLVLFRSVRLFLCNSIGRLNCLFTKNSKVINRLVVINFISLGGLPPFTGFVPKFMVMSEIVNNKITYILVGLLIGSLLRLYFYLRIRVSILIEDRAGVKIIVWRKEISLW